MCWLLMMFKYECMVLNLAELKFVLGGFNKSQPETCSILENHKSPLNICARLEIVVDYTDYGKF